MSSQIVRWTAALAAAFLLSVPSGALAQNAGPFSTGDNPASKQAEANFGHYQFRDGEGLDDLHIHYATMGQPHRNAAGDIDNAVLVLHWTGADGRAVQTPPYQHALYDPGRPLDAHKYFLIFADSVGHGRSSKPSDGLRGKFPHYGYNDIVDLQHRLVTETLGIKRLHAIVGMSMGGMNAWQWAEAYPDAVEGIMPVVSLPVKVSGRNLIWRRLAIGFIENDPDWKGGSTTSPPRGWTAAYELLHMMIDGVPHMQMIAPDAAGADKFIAEAATQASHVEPIDALYSLKSSADYDPEPDLGKITTRVLALNFGDDEFNPDVLQILETRMSRVKRGRYVVQPGSPTAFGRLTMAHPELWASHVGEFMEEIRD